MNWNGYIERGDVKRATKDTSLAKALLLMADNDLLFLGGLELNETSARKIMSNYYDTLRSILEAVAALDGYKVYSHEAFTYFLKEKKEDLFAQKFDRFRKIRNGINYYGKNISPQEVSQCKQEITRLIADIKAKYLRNFS